MIGVLHELEVLYTMLAVPHSLLLCTAVFFFMKAALSIAYSYNYNVYHAVEVYIQC